MLRSGRLSVIKQLAIVSRWNHLNLAGFFNA